MPTANTVSSIARLRLVGSFRLSGSDGKPIPVANRRLRGLLAFLACAPENTASRERLRGLLWSDRAEVQARASLRQCLLELRVLLTSANLDLIEVGREEVSLKAGALVCDVIELGVALAGVDAETLVGALGSIGTGRFLEDQDLGGLYRDWSEQARARLDETIAAGVATHLRRLESEGDWPKVRTVAEIFLRRDPLDEAVVATAIRADTALGNTTAAHRRFHILRTLLEKEFGVAPGAAAREALTGAPYQRLPTTHSTPATPGTVAGAPPLLIVTAFETHNAPSADTSIAATLRDEVLSGLARFRDLRVITDARPLDSVVAELSSERTGAYVLGASLRAGAEDRRLIVQLLRGEGHMIWSGRLDLPGPHFVRTIDDIIAQVVGAVLPTIDADMMRRPSHLPTDDAYRRYLIARDASVKARTFEEARGAADQLEAMVSGDPSFALPYLPLAYLYNTDFGYTRAGSSGAAERDRAFHLAKSALALDRGHVHGYTVTGWCHLRRRQWSSARMHLEQALALNPFHATRVMEAAFGFVFLGELDTARALLDRCLLLNPTPDDEFFRDLGLLEMIRGDHDRAASYFELIAEPTVWGLIYSAINAEMGSLPFSESAARALERVAAIWPTWQPLSVDGVVSWIAGHHPFQASRDEERFLAAARRTMIAAVPPT